ncbi:Abi-alpha family protein [Tsukamurella soli]|uniref:DUF4393 domain-containing protein n=1 Tax=Tsukamurella soli TaxID=644556 RepID=A0ABP8J2T4_9ACTN
MTNDVVLADGTVAGDDRALEKRAAQALALPEAAERPGGVLGRLNWASSTAMLLGREVGGSAQRLTRQFVSEAEHLIDVALPPGTPRLVVQGEIVEDADPAADTTPFEPELPTEEDLRRAGDRLLALSAETCPLEGAHPAFPHILRQLTPDEARILRLLSRSGSQPSVDVRTNRPFGVGSESVAAGLSMVAEIAGCRHPERITSYLGNLHRLGLIWFSKEPVELHRYELVQVQPIVVDAMSRAGRYAKIVRRSIEVTAFGAEFCASCFTFE